MNKSEFLNELQKGLTVLEDGEQKDIIEEYSQHIDMKISTGLSEEEAIRDFGSISDLAAQILEAYHVKPEYRSEYQADYRSEYREKRQEKAAEEGKKLWGRITGAARSACGSVKRFCGTCYRKGKEAAVKLWHLAGIPFRWLGNLIWGKKEKAVTADIRKERKMNNAVVDDIRPARNSSGGFLHSLGGLIVGGFGALWRGFMWCVRWGWNIFMFSLAVMSGFFTLGLLFLFAVLLVWLVQGFPIVGLTLACFGGVICFGAFTFLCITFMAMKKRNGGSEEIGGNIVVEEVQHA